MSKMSRPRYFTRLRLRLLSAALVAGSLAACPPAAVSSDWARFLGPAGASISPDSAKVPETWSDKGNVKWKADLPGIGVSSPIVVEGKVFVTGYSGYGTGGEDEKIEDLKRHLSCFDGVTGEQLWSKAVDAVPAESGQTNPSSVSTTEQVRACENL